MDNSIGSTPNPTEIIKRGEAAEAAKRASEWSREVEESDLLWLMSTTQGRRVLARLMSRTGQWHTTYRQDSRDSAFAEGMRNVTTPLLAQVLRLCPERFVQMTKEWTQHERAIVRGDRAADPKRERRSE